MKTVFGRQSEIPLIGPNYLGIIKLKGRKIGIVSGRPYELFPCAWRCQEALEPSFTASSGSDNLQADLSSFALKLEGKLPLKVIVIPVVLAWTHTHLYVHASHFHSTTNHHLADYHFPTHIHIHYTQNAPPNVRFILTTSITTHSCIYPFYHPITPTFSHHFPHPSYPLTSITTYPFPNIPSIPPHRLSTFSGHPFPIFHNTRTHIPILRGAFPRLIPKVNSCNHGKSLQGSWTWWSWDPDVGRCRNKIIKWGWDLCEESGHRV